MLVIWYHHTCVCQGNIVCVSYIAGIVWEPHTMSYHVSSLVSPYLCLSGQHCMCFLYSRYSLVQEPCTVSYHVSSLVSPYLCLSGQHCMCFLYSRYSLVQEPHTMSYHVSSLVSPYLCLSGQHVYVSYIAGIVWSRNLVR